jgi:WD40 repeat protein
MYLASVSNSLKVWDVSNFDRECKLHSMHRSISEFLCLSWNHTNQVVAVGGRENKVHIVQASNGSVLQSFQVTDTALTNFKVPTLSFSHNSRYLTIGVESSIQLWDLKKRQVKHVLTGHKRSIVSLQFNSNGDFFGADDEGSIKLWSLKSYEAVNITEDNRGVRPIHSLTKLAISPIAPVVAAGYDDGSLRVWDIANGINALCQLPLHMSKLTDISCSTKISRLLATASLDDHIQLIDTGAPSRYVCSTINVLLPVTYVAPST